MISLRSGGAWGGAPAQLRPEGAGKPNRVCVLALLLWRDVGIVSDSRTFQRGMSSRDRVKLKLRPFEIPDYSELGVCGISIDDRRGDRFHSRNVIRPTRSESAWTVLRDT